MLNCALFTKIFYLFSHKRLLFFIEDVYFLRLLSHKWLKMLCFCFGVFDFFINFLLYEIYWPYFAPLTKLFFGGRANEGYIFDPNPCNLLSQSVKYLLFG